MAEDLGSVKWRIVADTSDLDRAEKRMDEVGRSADGAKKHVTQMGREVESAGQKTKKAADTMHGGMMNVSQAVRIVTSALAALGATISVREVIRYSDEWRNAENQLRQVTKSTSDLVSVQGKLDNLAKDTRSSYSATTTLFARLTQSTHDMNLSQERLLRITESINKSFQIYGATTQEAENAIRQLSQGLAAGALRGEEFNSVAEQAPAIMDAIARHVGMTRGELREFAAEGGITAQLVVDAMESAADSIDEKFSKSMMTFGQSVEIAKTNALEFVGTSESIATVTGAAGRGVIVLSENMDVLGAAVGTVSVILATRFLPAMATAAAAGGPILAAAAAVGTLVLAMRNLSEISETAAENAIASWGKQGLGVVDLGIRGLMTELEAATAKLDEMGRFDPRRLLVDREVNDLLEKIAMAARTRVQTEADLAEGTIETAQADAEWMAILKELQDESSKLYKSIDKGSKDLKKVTEATDEHVRSLQAQLLLVGKTEREQFVLNETMKLGEGATVGTIGATIAYAGALYDQIEAQKDAEAAEKARQKAVESAAEAIEKANRDAARESAEEWRLFRDDFLDALADMLMQGESFTESMAESFKRMAYKIAGVLIASGIYNLFTGGGGFSVSETLKGAGTAGTITNAALSGLIAKGGGVGSFLGGLTGSAATPGSAAFVGPLQAGTGGAAGMGAGMAALAANPLTWAALALGVGAATGFWKDPDNYQRSMAGMLVAPTPGANPAGTFAVNPFSSGFTPTGFADRASRADAEAIIDSFRGIDKIVTDLVVKAGGVVDLSRATLAGLGVDATSGSDGTFLGVTPKTDDFAGQLDLYTTQLAAHVTGLDDALLKSIQSAKTAEEVVRLLTDAIDDKTEKQEKEELKAQEELQKATERAVNAASSLIDTYLPLRAVTEQYAEDVAKLDLLLEQGVVSADEYQTVLDGLNDSYDESVESLKKTEKAVIDVTKAQKAYLDMALQNVRLVMQAQGQKTGNDITRQIEAILESRDELLKSYEDEVSLSKQLHEQNVRNYEAQLQLARGIEAGIAGIMTGSDSALSGQDRLAFARSRFETLAERAANGDQEAAQQLVGAGQDVIGAARDVYASGSDFKHIFGAVTSRLGTVQGILGSASAPSYMEPSRAALDMQLALLDDQLTGIHSAIAVDAVNELVALGVTLDDLPEEIAEAIRSLFTTEMADALQIGANFGLLRDDVVTALGLLPQKVDLTQTGIASALQSLTSIGQFPQLLAQGFGSLSQALGAVANNMINQGVPTTLVADIIAQNQVLTAAANEYLSGQNAGTVADYTSRQNTGITADQIAAFVGTLPNTPEGARAAITWAQQNGVGSAQITSAIQGLYPGVTQQEILGLASSLGLPEFADGGTFRGPQSGGLAVLHGTETVMNGDQMQEFSRKLDMVVRAVLASGDAAAQRLDALNKTTRDVARNTSKDSGVGGKRFAA